MILHVCIRLLGGPTLPKNHGSGVEKSYWVGKVTRGQRMRHPYIHMYIHDSFADDSDSPWKLWFPVRVAGPIGFICSIFILANALKLGPTPIILFVFSHLATLSGMKSKWL